jgi:dihydrofolate reductase
MTISIIAAIGENRELGFQGGIPWHLPADFKRFKELTMGHPVIMGQRTFESIGKPLPGRTNIVLTKNADFHADGCRVVTSLDEAFDVEKGSDEAFIIGGGQIYHLAMPVAQKLYLTKVHGKFEADTFFPEWSDTEWRLMGSEPHAKDEKNAFDYDFCVYERK